MQNNIEGLVKIVFIESNFEVLEFKCSISSIVRLIPQLSTCLDVRYQDRSKASEVFKNISKVKVRILKQINVIISRSGHEELIKDLIKLKIIII